MKRASEGNAGSAGLGKRVHDLQSDDRRGRGKALPLELPFLGGGAGAQLKTPGAPQGAQKKDSC